MKKRKNPLALIIAASKKILAGTNYKLGLLFLSLFLALVYILLPVGLTPGNSIAFQVSILRPRDYLLFFILSPVTALLILMQIFLWRRGKKYCARTAGQGGLSVFSALFGGLLATAACSSCITAILGFLGAGSTFFILENQPYVVAASLSLVIIGLYFSARKVVGGDENSVNCSPCDNISNNQQ